MAGLTFAALLVPVLIAGSAHETRLRPRGGRRRSGPDYGAMAEVEERDIEQMLEGLNDRRRRNGKREIGEELSDELMRSSWD